MKIAFLGDSLTWGGYGGNFVDAVGRLLPDHTIINAGAGGNTVVNLLRRLEDVLIDAPDGVFVMVGGNDVVSYTQPATRPYYQRVQVIKDGIVTPDEFARTYRVLLTELSLNYIETWVGLEPTEYNPRIVEAMAQYNELARQVADSLNVPVLDLAAHFANDNPPEREPVTMDFINEIGRRGANNWQDYESERQRLDYTYTFDGMHLTPQAAKVVATMIVEFLQPYLS